MKQVKISDQENRNRRTVILAVFVVLAIGIATAVLLYGTARAPFRATVMEVNDTSIKMKYFLKRLSLARTSPPHCGSDSQWGCRPGGPQFPVLHSAYPSARCGCRSILTLPVSTGRYGMGQVLPLLGIPEVGASISGGYSPPRKRGSLKM